MAVQGNYAYVTAYSTASLAVVDISNPSAPTLVGSVQDWTNLYGADGVAVSGNYAYVGGDSCSCFTVLDISNPKEPTVVTSLYEGGIEGLTLVGNYVYAAAYSEWRRTYHL